MAARLLTLLLLACVPLVSTGCRNERPQTEAISIRGHEFTLDLAVDEPTRNLGLGGVTEIPEHGGMLFVFPTAQPASFWMKDCLIDIDIIYLDGRGRITGLHEMKAVPLRQSDETETAYHDRLRRSADYSTNMASVFAIELRAGWLEMLDLSIGDKIDLDIRRLRNYATSE